MSYENRRLLLGNGKYHVSKRGNEFHIQGLPETLASELIGIKIGTELFDRVCELEDRLEKTSGRGLPADAQIEFSEGNSITLDEGKYEIGMDDENHFTALRYGEPWRDLTGDNLMLAMFDRIQDYKVVRASQQELVKQLDGLINGTDDAAPSPSLCDIVSQVQSIVKSHNGHPIQRLVQFNGLSAQQAELLFVLLEEHGEAIQAVGKILRHGYESFHPHHPFGPTNRVALEKEEGDVCAAMDLLCKGNDLSIVNIIARAEAKHKTMGPYLHHQGNAKAEPIHPVPKLATAYCSYCNAQRTHHGDPDSIHLHLCDACNGVVDDGDSTTGRI